MRETVLENHSWIRGIGDLGLLTWLTALCDPAQLRYHRLSLDTALDRYPDAQQGRTKHLAWFLAGLAHARLAAPEGLQDLTDVAVETFQRLRLNQGEDGIFRHRNPGRSLPAFLGSRYGTFADQASCIYAFSKFAQAFQVEEPIVAAMECAAAICSLQGELGQWWWIYDVTNGRIANRYPIFSAHQDGLAPMSLFALEEVVGCSFHTPVYNGLRWIFGANELGTNLLDPSGKMIWDSMGPKLTSKYWQMMVGLLGISRNESTKGKLRIRLESRPDHFGWLLYALGKSGVQNIAVAAELHRNAHQLRSEATLGNV